MSLRGNLREGRREKGGGRREDTASRGLFHSLFHSLLRGESFESRHQDALQSRDVHHGQPALSPSTEMPGNSIDSVSTGHGVASTEHHRPGCDLWYGKGLWPRRWKIRMSLILVSSSVILLQPRAVSAPATAQLHRLS
eukprot:3940626-Rhodomonas_salina.3